MVTKSPWRTFLFYFLAILPAMCYVCTGVATTMLQQVIVANGGAGGLLVPFFNYTGMALLTLMPAAAPKRAAAGRKDGKSSLSLPRMKHVSDTGGTGASSTLASEGPPKAGQDLDAPSARPLQSRLTSVQTQEAAAGEGSATLRVSSRVPESRAGSEISSSVDGAADAAPGTASKSAAGKAAAAMDEAYLSGNESGSDNSNSTFFWLLSACGLGPLARSVMAGAATAQRWIPGGAFGRIVAMAICLDLCGFICGVTGLQMAGSGVFQVVHSSVVVWSALFNLWFLGIRINQGQWGGIIIIAFGLALSALGSVGQSGARRSGPQGWHRGALREEIRAMQLSAGVDPAEVLLEEQQDAADAAALAEEASESASQGTSSLVIRGVFVTLMGSALMAGNYVLIASLALKKKGREGGARDSRAGSAEAGALVEAGRAGNGALAKQESKTSGRADSSKEQASSSTPSGGQVTSSVGMGSALVMGVYVMLFAVPRWQTVHEDAVDAVGGSRLVLMLCYPSMVFLALLHNAVYLRVVGSLGAVAVGIVQALRAVGVFFLANYFYCGMQESQCLNPARLASCAAVAVGVALFVVAKANGAPGAVAPVDGKQADRAAVGSQTGGAAQRSTGAALLTGGRGAGAKGSTGGSSAGQGAGAGSVRSREGSATAAQDSQMLGGSEAGAGRAAGRRAGGAAWTGVRIERPFG